MHRWLSGLCLAAFFQGASFCGSSLCQADAPAPGKQVAKTFVSGDRKLEYLLFLPKGYGEPGRKWPVLLFLHGAGESGNDIGRVKVHGPPKLVEQRPDDFPCIVISPQAPPFPEEFQGRQPDDETKRRRREFAVKYWANLPVLPLLDDVCATHDADAKRIYLTGLSMGAFGSWHYLAEAPHRFAAAAVICGGGDPERAAAIAKTPVRVFHGSLDQAVKLDESIRMVEAVAKAGGKPALTIYYGVDHDSWTETYRRRELLEWMFEHSRE